MLSKTLRNFIHALSKLEKKQNLMIYKAKMTHMRKLPARYD